MTPEPIPMVDVWAASQASRVGLSEPYASAAQTESKPRHSACRASVSWPAPVRADEVPEIQAQSQARTTVRNHHPGPTWRPDVADAPDSLSDHGNASGRDQRAADSRLGLGTLTWARDTTEEQARGLLQAFVEAGGTLLDTAAAYGAGDAERLLGKLVGEVTRREDVVIATKAGFAVRDGKRVVDTSRRALLRDLAGSLERLGTDYVDLWQIHAWGEAPIEETLSALDHAVRQGMTRYVGVSNFVGWQTAQAATWQKAVPGRAPLTSLQVEYSLLARRAELELVPAAAAFGLGLFPWSPLGRGVLTGQYRSRIPKGSRAASDHFAWFVQPYLEQRSKGVVEAVAMAADGLDLTPLQVALLWVRDAPGVTAPLLGARTAGQLAPALATETMSLPAEIISALDDVSGGPHLGRQPAPGDEGS